ncbi:unnamed protein product [Boreogadus saida]
MPRFRHTGCGPRLRVLHLETARGRTTVHIASLQPCHCPVWEKHSIRYPTSSDAPFQSEILQACLSFLSASIQPCHVGGEDQLFSSG